MEKPQKKVGIATIAANLPKVVPPPTGKDKSKDKKSTGKKSNEKKKSKCACC